MIANFYLPVLKSKLGEFDALSKLNPDTKKSVVPLLDITPMEWDHSTNAKPKTIEVHLQNFCKKMIKKWPSDNTFIDTYLINDKNPDGISCFEYISKLLNSYGIHPLPIARVTNQEIAITGIKNVLATNSIQEIGIRVLISDLTSPDLRTNLQSLQSKLNISPANCHLILDLFDADFTNPNDFSDGIVYVLADFPNLSEWKSFTVCGGSFPATNLIKPGVNLVPRNEWKFYNLLLEKLKAEPHNRPINYGDYSMVAPGYVEFDPTKMSRSANIRYTHNDIWYVIKGKALKKSVDFKQYIAQATTILNSEYYFGETFSQGDAHLKKCSKGETTSGNPTVWNWVGNNHHFTKVVSDLFSNSRVA